MLYFAHKGKALMDSPFLWRATKMCWCKGSHDAKDQSSERFKELFYCTIQVTQTISSINAISTYLKTDFILYNTIFKKNKLYKSKFSPYTAQSDFISNVRKARLKVSFNYSGIPNRPSYRISPKKPQNNKHQNHANHTRPAARENFTTARERKQDYDRKSPEGFLLKMDGQSGEEKQHD